MFDVYNFIKEKVDELNDPVFGKTSQSATPLKTRPSSFKTETKLNEKKAFVQGCIVCKSDHQLFKCDAFKALDVSERRKLVREKGLCYIARDCKSSYQCQNCKGRHYNLLPVEKTSSRGEFS